MDYKYIEQLLERYWQCETTLQEEEILRTFFSQKDVPASLQQYQGLFVCEQQQDAPLGEDFDARVLEAIGAEVAMEHKSITPKAKLVRIADRLMPLFRAAAIVAIVLTLGNAAQAPWDNGWDSPEDTYARIQQMKDDSVSVSDAIRAENIRDTTNISTGTPVYIE
ncbi:MAG: pyruvate ferredoxin oxidoreductase [Prevotella sp.]|nr:pyruvate ferredoxin oxidoreductase [Prevotella sp.]